ncbi:flagellin N-terminal helical domain-containing protein [Paraglaciecola aestuariivivens]
MINLNSDSNGSLLQQVQNKQESILEKLASGKRINSASDGAAAQQIIDRLTTQVEGNRQAISNAFDGVSLAQVAEGGLAGINQDIERIRELTIQSGNGILSDSDRQALQAEVSQRQANIAQSIEQTRFAGQPLLSQNGEINFQVGASSGQKLAVNTQDVSAGLNDLLNIDLSNPQDLEQSLASVDSAAEFVGLARADLGATQNQFESTARNLSKADENVAAARSRIQDTDYAQAVSSNVEASILSQTTLAVQGMANQQQGQVLSLLNG